MSHKFHNLVLLEINKGMNVDRNKGKLYISEQLYVTPLSRADLLYELFRADRNLDITDLIRMTTAKDSLRFITETQLV